MNLKTARQFAASFRRLPRWEQQSVTDTIAWFTEDPQAEGLRNHPLGGSMTGARAIAADGDLRIVFLERGNYAEVRLIDVGHHGDVYRP